MHGVRAHCDLSPELTSRQRKSKKQNVGKPLLLWLRREVGAKAHWILSCLAPTEGSQQTPASAVCPDFKFVIKSAFERGISRSGHIFNLRTHVQGWRSTCRSCSPPVILSCFTVNGRWTHVFPFVSDGRHLFLGGMVSTMPKFLPSALEVGRRTT